MKEKITYLLALLLCCFNVAGLAATYYNKSSGTGALQTLSNWGTNTDGTGTAPSNFTTSGNIFNLYNGSTATITAAWVITGGTLNVGNGSAAMNLTIPSTASLTGTGVVNVNAGSTLTLRHTSNPTLGTLNSTSTVNYNGTGSQTIAAATYGYLIISGSRSGTPTITLPSGTISVSRVLSYTLTGSVFYSTTGNTFAYTATTGGLTIESSIPYYNLTQTNTSGTNTADGNITVSNVLTTTAGGTLDMDVYTLSVTGSPVNNGILRTGNTSTTPLPTGKSWAGTVIYDAAAGGQTIVTGTYATLTNGSTGGTNTANGAITVNTALNTTSGGIFDLGTNSLAGTLTTINNNGTLQTSSTSTTLIPSGKTWGGSGVVKYNRSSGSQTIISGTYNCDLLLNNSSGTNTASGVLTVNGSLSTTSGGTLNMGSYAIAGSPAGVSNYGTITTSSTTNPPLPAGADWSNGTMRYTRTTGGQRLPAGTYGILNLTNTSGTITALGAIDITTTLTTTSGGTLALGANQLTGSFAPTNNGTISTTCTANPAIPAGNNWTGTTGRISYLATTGNQYVPAGTYRIITFSNTSNTNTATGNLVVTSSITTSSSGGTLDLGVYTLSGSLTSFTNTGTLMTQNTGSTPIPSGKTVSGTVVYNAASGGQTIVPETSYARLTLGNTSGTSTAAGLLTVNTALYINAGATLDMTSAYRLAGTLSTITINGTFKTSVPTSVSSTPTTTGKIWGGTGDVWYAAAAGSQTVMAGTYNCNLIIGNSSGTNTASGVLTVNGVLTTTSGGTLAMSTYALAGSPTPVNNGAITTLSVTNPAIPAGKDWTGTTGNMIFLLATGGQYIPAGTYTNLKCSNTSGSNTALGVLTVNSSLITTSGGTLNMNTNQLLGSCTPVNNGTITTLCTSNPAIPGGQDWSGTTGNVTFTLTTGGQYVPAGTYKLLRFNNTSGTNTAVGDITVTGNMTTTAGGTVDMGTANELNGTGTFTNGGTISTSVPISTSATPIPAGLTWTGTIQYGAAAGGQTLVGGTYTNLVLSNTSGINTASGDIVVNTGTMTTTAGGTTDMTDLYLLSGTGTFTNNGNIATSVPTSLSATPIPAGKVWGGTITYDAATGGQTIVSETSYNNLAFSNTSGTNTSAANLVVNGTLTTSAGGIQDMGNYTLLGSLSTISGSGTILIGNTSGTPIQTSKTWTQTIEYDNATGGQTIVSGTYAGLTNSNTSGTNTVVSAGSVSVTGDLTLASSSNMSTNGVTIALAGNILGTGTATGTGGISMTGSGATISGATLNNLTLNNSGGFSLSGGATINGTLTLTLGKFTIGANDLTLGASAGAVSGTFSSSRMIVADGTGRVIKQFSATGSYLYPIGDNTSNYSPVTVGFTGGTFAGGAYAGVNVTDAKHPQNANTTNYITRYWSVNTSGITSPVYNVTATYVTGDVTGTEASISMGRYPGSLPWVKYGATNTSTHTLTATAVTDISSDFTGIASANANVSISPSSAAICSGATVNLTATGSGSPTLVYSWAPSTGLSATTGASVTSSVSANTVAATYVYTVTMTDGNGFIATATSSVTVNPAPVITGSVNVCVGMTSGLSANLSGGTWTSSNTARATVGSASGIVTGVTSGAVVITYTLPTGCIATLPVTVNAVPSAITGLTVVCAGGSITLSESVPGGAWSSSDTDLASVTPSGVVTGESGGVAIISYISGPSCYVTRTVTVGPISAITGTLKACVGMTTALTSATSGGVWSSSSTSIATIGTGSGTATGVAVGATTISYSIGTGCARTAILTVNAVPSAIGGTSSVCEGLTTTLIESVSGGTWSSSNTAVASVGTGSGVVTGVAAGTATISYISGASCYVARTVTVNPLPATVTGTMNVCSASSTALSDATTGGTWSSSNSSLATVGSATGIVTGVASGNPVITYTLATGCIKTAIVTVNPVPASITGTTNVCVGLTRTLSCSTGGGVWSSTNTSLGTVGTGTGVVTGVSAGTLSINYTLTSTGCFASAPFTVNALPATIGGTAVVCASSSTTLTNTSGGGTWISGNTGVAAIGSSTGVVTGVASGNSTITYTLATGCTGTRIVTVYPVPATITGTANVCVGLTRTLACITTGGVWSSSNTSVATIGSSTGVVTGVSAGTLNLTYTLSAGCTATKAFTVNSLPAGISGSSGLCDGETMTLTNATTGGTWSSSDVTNATVGSASGIVTAVSSGAAAISYTLPTGCRATKPITVNDLPASIAGVVDTCAGLSITLTDPTAGGVWSSSNTGIVSIGSSSGIASGISAGTAIITYTLSSTGCYTTEGMQVNPMPATITGTMAVCVGFVTTLDNVITGGTWESTNISVADIDSASGDVTGMSTGTATITYTLSPGCRATTVVTVRAVPSLSGVSDNGPICAGTTLTLVASGATNVTSYTWTGPVPITSSTSSTATVPSASIAADGTYTLTVTNGPGVGCSEEYTTTVTVNATPTAAPTNNSPVCTGASVSLTANPAGTTDTYLWSGANLSSTTVQNPTATPTVTTTYSLTVSYAGGLPGCSPATVYTTIVTVNAIPTASPTNASPSCSGNSVTLTANPAGSANTYLWSGANLSSTTAQNPTATPTVTSTYSLTVSYGTGRPGCSPSTVYTTTVTVYPTGRWLGTVDTNWNNNSNWCGNVPVITTDVFIPGSITNYPSISSGTYPSRNVTIQSGATLKINGGFLQIAGAISNSGTFTAYNGGVEMNGSSSQSIPAGVFNTNTIKNLTINNSAGVSLGGTLGILGILKVTSGTFTTGGYITLKSSSSQTALIDGSGSGAVSGNVTMQRYLDSSYGYRYISSPFQAALVGQLSSYISLSSTFPNFYGYNENVNYAGWVIDTAVADTIKPMYGYAANFGSSFSSSTFALTGAVNNGSMSRTLYNNNNTYTQGFNFVGNPYPSPIDWAASSGWTKTNIDNAIYFFNHGDTNRYYGRYSSYIAGVSSDGIANNIIPAMQGFFVHVTNGSYPVTATLGFSNAVRTTGLTPHYFRQTAGDRPLVRISAGFTGDAADGDAAVVYFDDLGTVDFEKELDALKLMNTDNNIPSFYSVSHDSKHLSIQALPALTDSQQLIPLGIHTEKDGVITFNARTIEHMPAGMHVWFYDVKTGATQDMNVTANYQVPLSAGDNDNRFFLLFSKSDTVNIPGLNGALNAYTSGGSLFVYMAFGEGEVVITNMAGQTVGRKKISGSGYHEMNMPLSSGVYIVTLHSGIGKQSKKIFFGHE